MEDMEHLENEGILVEGDDGSVEDMLRKPIKGELEENVENPPPGSKYLYHFAYLPIYLPAKAPKQLSKVYMV